MMLCFTRAPGSMETRIMNWNLRNQAKIIYLCVILWYFGHSLMVNLAYQLECIWGSPKRHNSGQVCEHISKMDWMGKDLPQGGQHLLCQPRYRDQRQTVLQFLRSSHCECIYTVLSLTDCRTHSLSLSTWRPVALQKSCTPPAPEGTAKTSSLVN